MMPHRLQGETWKTGWLIGGRFAAQPISLIFLVSILLLPLTTLAGTGTHITGYRPIFQPCADSSGTRQVAIRRYEVAGTPYVLLVNPRSLATSVATLASIRTSEAPLDLAQFKATAFGRALIRSTAPPFRLQNHGMIRADHPVAGEFLTVDLCPSRKPFERAMFEAVMALPQHREGAVPVAIAISGNWLEHHRKELAWLKEQAVKGNLAITWVNHSYSHPYEPRTPLERNFLLSPAIDFTHEVLATEQLLLEDGLVPAPFFRFPGLVADGTLLARLRELSLIPLGSDAWLAKGEQPKDGSVILVHGNGNEPRGIEVLLPLLRSDRGVQLLPLQRAVAGAE
jgi:hypothetical protein